MEESNIDRPFLMGDKIYLRPLDIDDVNDTYLNWINDGEVINNLATVFPSSREDLTNFVSNHIKNRNFVFFAIIEKQSNKHIGNAKLGPIDWISRTSNYGIMIGDKNSWGKGYAQETHALALKYAFEKINLHKIWDIAVDAID